MTDTVNHPSHYGGADNPYEAIKVIEAWRLGFNLGNTVKYISRADHKGATLEDLEKARWYLDREIANHKAVDVQIAEATNDAAPFATHPNDNNLVCDHDWRWNGLRNLYVCHNCKDTIGSIGL